MGVFRPGYLKEGPGILKEEEPKKGMALFVEIWVREFWQILKGNVLFFICSLPLLTFGAARAALSRCTMNMVRDIPNDVWRDFRRELKKDFPRNTAVGLVELFGIGTAAVAASLPEVRESVVLETLLLLCVFSGSLFFGYLWPLLVTVNLSLRAAVKDALLLPLLSWQHSLPAFFSAAALIGISLWMFPLSLPVLLFVPFGMGSFIMSFAAWSDIQRLLIHNYEQNGEKR